MAKKSRRQRKAETAKAVSNPVSAGNQKVAQTAQAQPVTTQTDDISGSMAQKAITFAQDYHYVYTDIRILAIVTALAIILMFSLSFVF